MPHHGDHVRGELSPTAKLTADAVLALREISDAGRGVPDKLLIDVFSGAWDITELTIRYVLIGRSWAHVGGPVRPANPKWITRRGPRYCPLDGMELEQDSDGNGVVQWWCVGCDRRRAGLCMDCGGKIQSRAWRCAPHAYAHKRKLEKECYQRHIMEYRRACANGRRYSNRTPEQNEHNREVRRRWKARNPEKEIKRRRKQRLKGCGGWATKEQNRAYHAAYRQRNRERLHAQQKEIRDQKRRERQIEQRRAIRPKCRVCGADIPWTPGQRGRPALRCRQHNPYMRGARRKAA